ncbi:EAL domain-containing protein [Candidatus Venteria ishoeyi]|uniref:Phytochrome-like protein cph2 n=1 Tax=Candidatus Venteria ishoeyi TaxID=1899563 RepID=A0A1H6F3B0_9GAMM|nr:EAL domain-containing protein [Candidatus Venteria ishoeyi]SEH04647.1 Phytochrome-like protein cph2 [Candidatus Venteria ishoeyi]
MQKSIKKIFSSHLFIKIHHFLFRSEHFRGISVTVASFVLVFLLLGGNQLGWFQSIELKMYDWMMRQRPALAPDPRLLIISISEADIQKHNSWPLSDAVVAQTLKIIADHKPTAIGLDIYRDVPHPPGQAALLEQLQASNVYSVFKVGKENTHVPPPKGVDSSHFGFSDLVLDSDRVLRRNLLYLSDYGKTQYSLALRLTMYYLWQQGVVMKNNPKNPEEFKLGDLTVVKLTQNAGGYRTFDNNAGYQTLLSYRSKGAIAREVSLSDVLDGKLKAEWVKDKIVLIGTTAPSEKDMYFTPFTGQTTDGMVPGVMIHAHAISQLLTGALDTPQQRGNWPLRYQAIFDFLPEWAEALWIVLWLLSGVLLGWFIKQLIRQFIFFSIAGGLLLLIGLGFFIQGIWLPVASAFLAFSLALISVITIRRAYLALYDNLTGLPNRTLFSQQLRKAQYGPIFSWLRKKTSGKQIELAVLLLDLERFKVINAVLGPETGDRLLQAFAERLCTQNHLFNQKNPQVRSYLARVGGTEFALLLHRPLNSENTLAFAKKIQHHIMQPFQVQTQDIFTYTNIGIALYHGETDRALLRDAHAAMNRAKALAKNTPEIFEDATGMDEIEHFQVESDLRRSVRRYQVGFGFTQGTVVDFPVYYQPVVSLKTGKIAGFEALVRWRHPDKGLVSPIKFIAIAEETGLIVSIGEWVLIEACRQAQRWKDQYPEYEDLILSVNLSGKQFEQTDLTERVTRALENSGLAPHSLKLEITESMMMKDLSTTEAALERLKALDIQLSIDDFGTGYSSLAYLTQFPTNTLKIDKAFITNMTLSSQDRTIVRTITSLAHDLKMDVTAEGIEEPEQFKHLRSLGCEYGQGYLFAKPLPVEEAEALLASNPIFSP